VEAPDGINLDAVMHYIPGTSKLLLVAYNTTERRLTRRLALPLEKLGLPAGGYRRISMDGAAGSDITDSFIEVTVDRYDAGWIAFDIV